MPYSLDLERYRWTIQRFSSYFYGCSYVRLHAAVSSHLVLFERLLLTYFPYKGERTSPVSPMTAYSSSKFQFSSKYQSCLLYSFKKSITRRCRISISAPSHSVNFSAWDSQIIYRCPRAIVFLSLHFLSSLSSLNYLARTNLICSNSYNSAPYATIFFELSDLSAAICNLLYLTHW